MRYRKVTAACLLYLLPAMSCDRGDARVAKPAAGAGSTDKVVAVPYLDGDLIFQESTSGQSDMVRALTGSRWTHMGVIFHIRSIPHVFEAVSPVRWTPLSKWIARGRGGQYVVRRLSDASTILTPSVIAKMRETGSGWVGRPYDPKFKWDDASLYCSELAYKLYERGAGVRLGQLQRAPDMHFDDELVQKAVRQRFGSSKFDPNETVITPDSIFSDPRLVTVAQ